MPKDPNDSWLGSQPHVTHRLCTTIVFFIGVVCICAGYLLGRASQDSLRRNSEVVPYNLTVAAENLYKKARKISFKIVHHTLLQNDTEKITKKLMDIFHCHPSDCGIAEGPLQIASLVKQCVNIEVDKLLRAIYNATCFMDSLR